MRTPVAPTAAVELGPVIEQVGYEVVVADGLLFWLGDHWRTLFALDSHIRETSVRSAVTGLLAQGVTLTFGDATLPTIPLDGAVQIAVLRDQLRRIRHVAPHALAAGADTFARILATDPWGRIYTPAVLAGPPSTPVRVMVAAELTHDLALWRRLRALEQFSELRALVLHGAPLGWLPLSFDLAAFPALAALDLSRSSLRSLPASIADATALEAVELADNPIELAGLMPLTRLPRLRYVGLHATEVTATEAATFAAWLPPHCEVHT